MLSIPKHLFYVTSEQLCAYRWQRGALSEAETFAADRAGMEAFGAWLRERGDRPAYVVADLVEEDFQRQMLPHVGPRARRGMVQRRMALLHRDTPFRQALVQGRDPQGRRDDIYLFSALTNPAVLQPWMKIIEQARVPLAAVYSATFLNLLLVRRLAMVQPHLLLITRQSGGVRQTYFQDRHVKFSRLTAMTPHESFSATVAEETDRMHQFLTSTRMAGRGEMLRVVVLAPAELLPKLEAACEDGPEIAFHFIDMATAAARMKLDTVPALADELLLTLVGRNAPPSHYGTGGPGRLYRLWQARMGLYAGTAAALAGSAAMAIANTWIGIDAGRTAAGLVAATPQYEARYRAVMSTVPPTPTRTANMRAAVSLEQLVRVQGPRPGPLVTMLSGALERAPAIRLGTLEWRVRKDALAAMPAPAQPVMMGAQQPDAPAPLASTALGVPNRPVEVLRIDGEIEVPGNAARAAIDAMNAFALDLARNPRMAVEILTPPVDVRPNVRLAGKAERDAPVERPRFALRLTWAP